MSIKDEWPKLTLVALIALFTVVAIPVVNILLNYQLSNAREKYEEKIKDMLLHQRVMVLLQMDYDSKLAEYNSDSAILGDKIAWFSTWTTAVTGEQMAGLMRLQAAMVFQISNSKELETFAQAGGSPWAFFGEPAAPIDKKIGHMRIGTQKLTKKLIMYHSKGFEVRNEPHPVVDGTISGFVYDLHFKAAVLQAEKEALLNLKTNFAKGNHTGLNLKEFKDYIDQRATKLIHQTADPKIPELFDKSKKEYVKIDFPME